jgi:hypothetical protein
MHVMFAIDTIHHESIDKDQADKDDYRSLLGEPEAERHLANRNGREWSRQNKRGNERDQRPDGEQYSD